MKMPHAVNATTRTSHHFVVVSHAIPQRTPKSFVQEFQPQGYKIEQLGFFWVGTVVVGRIWQLYPHFTQD
jgi:hypothetical protein